MCFSVSFITQVSTFTAYEAGHTDFFRYRPLTLLWAEPVEVPRVTILELDHHIHHRALYTLSCFFRQEILNLDAFI